MLYTDESLAFHLLATHFGRRRRALHHAVARAESFCAAARAVGISPKAFDAARRALSALSLRIVLHNDVLFPPLLREIPDPPRGLYYRGSLVGAHEPCIAIVGARNASTASMHIAENFAGQFARERIPVVSGLARGIDATSHNVVTAHGGITLAVLPGGLAQIYPRRHRRLAENIVTHGGAVISEYPPDLSPHPYMFLERNRLISGLSRGVLVIQAGRQSGALSTASHAGDQGRDLFVVPGTPHDPLYAGSHALIQDGGALVTQPSDVLSDIQALTV